MGFEGFLDPALLVLIDNGVEQFIDVLTGLG
jgi:hypothetical protein